MRLLGDPRRHPDRIRELEAENERLRAEAESWRWAADELKGIIDRITREGTR